MSIFLPNGQRVVAGQKAKFPTVMEFKMADGRLLKKVWEGNMAEGMGSPTPAGDQRDEWYGQAWQTKNDMRVLVSEDNTEVHGRLLHLSVSYQKKDPTWKELINIKELFFGDVDACMMMPRLEDYVNVHKHAYHIWELPVSWGIK